MEVVDLQFVDELNGEVGLVGEAGGEKFDGAINFNAVFFADKFRGPASTEGTIGFGGNEALAFFGEGGFAVKAAVATGQVVKKADGMFVGILVAADRNVRMAFVKRALFEKTAKAAAGLGIFAGHLGDGGFIESLNGALFGEAAFAIGDERDAGVVAEGSDLGPAV